MSFLAVSVAILEPPSEFLQIGIWFLQIDIWIVDKRLDILNVPVCRIKFLGNSVDMERPIYIRLEPEIVFENWNF